MSSRTLTPLLLVLVFLAGCIGGGEEDSALNKLSTTIIEDVPSNQTTTRATDEPGRTTTIKHLNGVSTIPIVEIPAEHGEIIVPKLSEGNTFKLDPQARICKRGTRIIVRMYSNTTCEECIWVRETYDKVVKEWAERGEIYPIRWEIDLQDNALTREKEEEIPPPEMHLLRRYSPEKKIPTFLIGCKYYREGTGYYETQDTVAEERELQKVIADLVLYNDRRDLADSYYNAGPPHIISDYTTSTYFTSSTSSTSTTSTSTTSTSSTTTTSTTSTTIRIPNWKLTPYVPDLPPPGIPGTPQPS